MEKGPVQILCKEIGFPFSKSIERDDVIIAFVRQLVDEVGEMAAINTMIASKLGGTPSHDCSSEIIAVGAMLEMKDRSQQFRACDNLHIALDQENNDPCDHYMDMLSSCVSAIRFGLEKPCHSRHAAEAANHIWKHKYGVHLFDEHTPKWENDWACSKMQEAIVSLMVKP